MIDRKNLPIERIPIDELDYLWADIEGSKFFNKRDNEGYKQIEKNLTYTVGFEDDSEDMLKIDGLWDRETLDYHQERVYNVYKHIVMHSVGRDWEAAMANPLIVVAHNNIYSTLAGNRRLCALRALGWKGDVKCVISDSWNYKSVKEFPYIEVKDWIHHW